jgi:antitoxin VapB
MALNIKNPETYKLAQELSKQTGETMTDAVTIAVRERLERVRHARRGTRLKRLQRIVDDLAPRFKEPFKSIDHGDLLYDENGMPK